MDINLRGLLINGAGAGGKYLHAFPLLHVQLVYVILYYLMLHGIDIMTILTIYYLYINYISTLTSSV